MFSQCDYACTEFTQHFRSISGLCSLVLATQVKLSAFQRQMFPFECGPPKPSDNFTASQGGESKPRKRRRLIRLSLIGFKDGVLHTHPKWPFHSRSEPRPIKIVIVTLRRLMKLNLWLSYIKTREL